MRRCALCGDWTAGSQSVNGHFCACLCQECRDLEDHAADLAAQNTAAAIDRVLDAPQELETIG